MVRSLPRFLAANVSLLTGMVLGLKAADYLMWDETKYEMLKEQIEVDYWRKHGHPEAVEGMLQKSKVKEGEFYVTYLRVDQSLEKAGDMEHKTQQ